MISSDVLHLLLVEDDDGDALLVEELLREAGIPAELMRAWSLEAALDTLGTGIDCILLDLGLPDASGLDALVELREASDSALVVLTGLDDSQRGVQAVAAGADDYLVKGQVDGEALGRAVRYAVERRRGARERREQERHRAHAEKVTQLAQQLRPAAHVPQAPVRLLFRSDGRDALSAQLCDVVERPDGTVLATVATADGAGTAAAALAATVRAAFRALALSELSAPGVLEVLDRVVAARRQPETVGLLAVELDPAVRRATCHLAGHRPPLMLSPEGVRSFVDAADHGAALGSAAGPRPVYSAPLGERDRLLLVHNSVLQQVGGDDAERSSLAMVLDAATRGAGDETLADTVQRAVRAYGSGHAEVQVLLLGWAPA